MEFFHGFNFDTVLAIISCITGIVALFLGGTAYKNCKISKNTVKQKKKFDAGSTDNSITVGGDYNHSEGISETGLISVIDKMNAMTSASFSTALDGAYTMFQAKCDDNLHTIMEKTEKIIKEQKLDLGGYNKIDWIHVYFESAKNTSDTYMQEIWAKVLAKELSEPDSFSYKTLDALKNMSSEEFKLFENIHRIMLWSTLAKGDYLKNNGMLWYYMQKLKEFGLLNLEISSRSINIKANADVHFIINCEYVMFIKNHNAQEKSFNMPCYMFTNVAMELGKIVNRVPLDLSFAIDIAKEIDKIQKPQNIVVELYKIVRVDDDNKGFEYENVNLLENIDKDNSLVVAE